jgi:predicted CxxxxCH...CXXCH cytochrome family protein
LGGNSLVTVMGVGAHQAHLKGSAWSRPVPCVECHVVPDQVDAPAHIDDWSVAEVTFSGAASARNRAPMWDRQAGRCSNTWCHGADSSTTTSPIWTDTAVSFNCSSCHGAPPPAPHVQLTQCNLCHSNARPDGTFTDASLHVNGSVDF